MIYYQEIQTLAGLMKTCLDPEACFKTLNIDAIDLFYGLYNWWKHNGSLRYYALAARAAGAKVIYNV
jgi:hypothetical protein